MSRKYLFYLIAFLTLWATFSVNPKLSIADAVVTSVSGINCATITLFSPDSDTLFLGGSCDGMVYALETGDNRTYVRQTLSIGLETTDMAITPDGKKLYVLSYTSGMVTVIDTATMQLLKDFSIDGYPAKIISSPVANKMFILDEFNGKLISVDTEIDDVTGSVFIGEKPEDLAISKDGASVYVINGAAAKLSAVDASTLKIRQTIDIPEGEHRLYASPDGNRLIITTVNNPNNLYYTYQFTIDVYNTSDFSHIGGYTASGQVSDVVLSANSMTAYALTHYQGRSSASYDEIRLISLNTGAEEKKIMMGYLYGSEIGLSPGGEVLYVATGSEIKVVDASDFEILGSITVKASHMTVSPIVYNRIYGYDDNAIYAINVPPYLKIHGPTDLAEGEEWLYTAQTVMGPPEAYAFSSGNSEVLSIGSDSGLASGVNEGSATIAVRGKTSGESKEMSIKVFDKTFLARVPISSPAQIFFDDDLNTAFVLDGFYTIYSVNAQSLRVEDIGKTTLSQQNIRNFIYDSSKKRLYVLCAPYDYTGDELIIIDAETKNIINTTHFESTYFDSLFLTPDKSNLVLVSNYNAEIRIVNAQTFAVNTMPDITGQVYTSTAGTTGDVFFILGQHNLYKVGAGNAEIMSNTPVDFGNLNQLVFYGTAVSDDKIFVTIENDIAIIEAGSGIISRIKVIDETMWYFSDLRYSAAMKMVYAGLYDSYANCRVKGVSIETEKVSSSSLMEGYTPYIRIDDNRGIVYTINRGEYISHSKLTSFDAVNLNMISQIGVDGGPRDFTLDNEGKRLFISAWEAGSVGIFGTDDLVAHPRSPQYYVNNSNGHLVAWKRSRLNGWFGTDLTGEAGSALIQGEPFAIATSKAEYVFARSPESALLMWKKPVGGNWSVTDLSKQTTGALISSDPFSAVHDDGHGNEVLHVFAGGETGHVLEWWRLNTDFFHVEDLTVLAGGNLAYGRPAYIYENGVQHVMTRDENGHLVEWWWASDTGWHMVDITALFPGSDEIAGNPTYVHEEGVQNVYVRSEDNRLLEFWWTSDTGWHREDLSTLVGGGKIIGRPVHFNAEDARHIFARNTDNQLIEWWWTADEGWHLENISAFCNHIALHNDPKYDQADGVQFIMADTGESIPTAITWTKETGWGCEKMLPFYARNYD